MTEQRCTTRNVIKKQLVNEPTWHSVDPIQATGDVPVYQQCGIDTIVGTVSEITVYNIIMHAAMHNIQEIIIHCLFTAVHLLVQ